MFKRYPKKNQLILLAYLRHDSLYVIHVIDHIGPLVILIDRGFGVEEPRVLRADRVLVQVPGLSGTNDHGAEKFHELFRRVVDGFPDFHSENKIFFSISP